MSFLKKVHGWFYKDTRMVVRTGSKLVSDKKLYEARMATIDPENKQTYYLDENSTVQNYPDMTGSYGIHINTDPIDDFMSIFDSFFGQEMDVASQAQMVNSRGDYIGVQIGISVNNPTIGYPYAEVVDGATKLKYTHNFYADESYDFVLSDGRVVRVTRLEDTDVKEFRIDLDN